MGKIAGVLDGGLVVVRGFQQAGSPGRIRDGLAILLIGLAIAICIREPIGIRGGIISNTRTGHFLGIHLDRAIQNILQALDLIVDAFFGITVAIVVNKGAWFTIVLQVINGLDAFMAKRALLDLYLQTVLVVTAEAGVISFHVTEFRIVGFAIVLITHLSLRTIEGRTGG